MTCGDSGAALSQEVGAGATEHVVAPELPRVGTRELWPRDTWPHLSYPEPGLGSWRHGRCGNTQAASVGWHNPILSTRGHM
jgi:hypothetical protein